MRRKRGFYVRSGLAAALALLLVTATTACESKGKPEASPDPGQVTTIAFSAPETGTGTAQRLAEAFMRLHPEIKVNITQLPPVSSMHDEYVNKLVSGDKDIDLFAMDVIWIKEFASAGWLAPLTSYFNQDDLKDIIDVPLESVYSQGTMYALPWYADMGMLFYRKDLLEQIGQPPPRTWSELIEQSKLLQQKGLTEYGYLFQGNAYEGLTLNFLEQMWNNGGDILENAGHWKLDEPEAVEALAFMQRLLKEGISPPRVLSLKETESREWFLQGKSAFLRSGPIVWGLAKNGDYPVQGKIGIAPLPVGPRGTLGGAGLGGFSIGMNAHITEPRRLAAIQFLKFLIGEQAQKQIAMNDSRMPAANRPYQDPDVLAFNPYYPEIEAVLKHARFRPRVAQYSEISSVLQIGLHDALTEERKADEVIQALNRILQQLPANSGSE